jgi:hypothetical protein
MMVPVKTMCRAAGTLSSIGHFICPLWFGHQACDVHIFLGGSGKRERPRQWHNKGASSTRAQAADPPPMHSQVAPWPVQ